MYPFVFNFLMFFKNFHFFSHCARLLYDDDRMQQLLVLCCCVSVFVPLQYCLRVPTSTLHSVVTTRFCSLVFFISDFIINPCGSDCVSEPNTSSTKQIATYVGFVACKSSSGMTYDGIPQEQEQQRTEWNYCSVDFYSTDKKCRQNGSKQWNVRSKMQINGLDALFYALIFQRFFCKKHETNHFI